MSLSLTPALAPTRLLLGEVSAAGLAALLLTARSPRRGERWSAPRQIPSTVATHPVLLLHGIWHNETWSLPLQRTLTEHGFACYSRPYQTFWRGIDQAAEQVADQILTLGRDHDGERIHVVAHSLGGLVLRRAVTAYQLADRLASVVTIGTPHGGSPLAVAAAHRLPAVGPMLRQLAPHSAFLTELDAQTTATAAAWTAISCPEDEVVPGLHGQLSHPKLAATNVVMANLGHLALMFDPQVLTTVTAALTEHD